MDAKEILLAAIDSALAAQIISQEDLVALCDQDGSALGSYTQNKRIKEEVADYLNNVNAVSLNNFSNVMRLHHTPVRYKKTLERCLAKGCFAYRQKVNNRVYYVKDPRSKSITIEEIVL